MRAIPGDVFFGATILLVGTGVGSLDVLLNQHRPVTGTLLLIVTLVGVGLLRPLHTWLYAPDEDE